MIELLEAAAAARGGEVAVASAARATTYDELRTGAHAVATALLDRGLRRIAVLSPEPAEVLAVLAACSRVGVEACVYPLAATDEAVDEMVERFGHEVVVTDRGALRSPTIPPRELLETAPQDLPPVPESRPIMVMTTGTSGFPRGVRHEWERLLRAVRRIKPAPDQRWLLAYGLNQFGGLQILIHVLAAHATLVAARSFQPRDALDAIRDDGVTHASGTPTFWRFVLAEMAADGGGVPGLRQVTLGGEAVPGALLERLKARFPDANISQIYGATEFGQNVTVRDGLPGLPLSMLEPGGDVEFKIVDGELWVRSKASMLGYHGEERVEDGAWRATGDLVEVVSDRVEFRGRKTDVINVGGIKVHPIPVEERVSRVPGVSLVRAYGRPNPMTGSVVGIEIVLEPGHDAETVEMAARAACSDLPPAARPRSIRFLDTMSTTGNKMLRGAAR
ncbi:class I adenylate-forming enzyme family protein [Nocardioides sp. SYSU DS0651]|uniref:class I adenylate-forming enzyme family protein n=1 Tax=Nocardioides sp. SYSU DS0651 TaxID=3415955 RepID=UPI003F4B97C8